MKSFTAGVTVIAGMSSGDFITTSNHWEHELELDLVQLEAVINSGTDRPSHH
ncbi:hypothetical protein [Xenorhabdus sp. PB62.4]|uniref:hypothetical protein n=1 Tax=Xenorhabdus sp. PB62.4 TaxID=1851573 RepID=UPI001656F00E|nr:hypothetical protein [Xenorhabdus sp. PB62.4]